MPSASNLTALLPLTATLYGTGFDANITFGNGQTYSLVVDTGSADTWILGSGWKCLQESKSGGVTQVGRQNCRCGNAEFDYNNAESGFKEIDGLWLGDQYGSGNTYGVVGYENLRIGDIELKHQQIGVVNKSLQLMDGVAVGIMALGYPSISAVHPNSYNLSRTLHGDASLLEDRIVYPTVFRRLMAAGMDGYISLALERTAFDEKVGFGGYIGFGTLPPVRHGAFATTPVEITHSVPKSLTNGTAEITEWTLTVQSVSYTSADGTKHNVSTPFQTFVDSGNPLNLVPPALASSINAAFDPPAKLTNPDTGFYAVDCNATAPVMTFEIANANFDVDPRDMIIRAASGNGCYTSVRPSAAKNIQVRGAGLNVMGDAFLKNVVAVLDMEKDEMRFAQRLGDEGSPKTPSGPGTSSLPTSPPSTGAAGKVYRPLEVWSLIVVIVVYILA